MPYRMFGSALPLLLCSCSGLFAGDIPDDVAKECVGIPIGDSVTAANVTLAELLSTMRDNGAKIGWRSTGSDTAILSMRMGNALSGQSHNVDIEITQRSYDGPETACRGTVAVFGRVTADGVLADDYNSQDLYYTLLQAWAQKHPDPHPDAGLMTPMHQFPQPQPSTADPAATDSYPSLSEVPDQPVSEESGDNADQPLPANTTALDPLRESDVDNQQ